MIEIIALIFLTRRIGRLAAKKGLTPGRWKLIMVLSWFGLEIAGVLVGLKISNNMYLAGLLGLAAAFGGFLLVQYRLEQFADLPDDDFLKNLGR